MKLNSPPQSEKSRDQLVRSLAMFEALDEPTIESLAKHSRVLKVGRGEVIVETGDYLDGFYGTTDGKLKLYILSCNGHERVIRLLNAGDSFGEAIMFNGIASPVRVEALSSSMLLFFPKVVVMDVFMRRAEMPLVMLQSMSRLMEELVRTLEDCCTRNARQRVAHYLIRQFERSGHADSTLELPASKIVVASLLDLSAETFSRELHNFSREDLLRVSRRTIYLRNIDALRSIASPKIDIDNE